MKKNMKKTNKLIVITFAIIGWVLFGCEDLNVPNENNPDLAKALATPEDVQTLAGGIYNTIFYGEHSHNGMKPMMAVAADNVTCSYGNFDMRWMSNEPRNLSWNNSPTYGTENNNRYSYNQWYSAIGSASDVLRAIDQQGVLIVVGGVDQTQLTKAVAKFGLGLAYGNLALTYDRAHIVDDTKNVEVSLDSSVPYPEVADAAIAYLEEALALTEDSYTFPKAWFGTAENLSGADFKKLINTSIARILSYLPRNKTQLAAVDWAKVKTRADAGITSSWIIVQDNNIWWFGGDYYTTTTGWARVDMYVAHLMEPSLPQHWTNEASFPHPAKPTDPMDSRLETDFQYLPSNDFPADRGYYHFSAYRFKRYDDVIINGVGGLGPKPTMLLAETDLLRAEARAYTGDLAGAAAIINAGTRVTRGNLDPVAEDLEAIIQAIHHERHVELYATGGMIHFYEMRKLDLLQKGTPLHLPIPGQVLQLLGLSEYYTFGGIVNPDGDGTGTSNGGWR
jgi:starch-binding outer membrane protein, SusD/RagB family